MSEMFFLPMKREAIFQFKRFLDVDIAKPFFEYIINRRKEEISEHEFENKYSVLYKWETEYKFHLIQLQWEFGLLYRFTAPYIHIEIQKQNDDDLAYLGNKLNSKKLLRKTLTESNKYHLAERLKYRDGELRWEVTERDKSSRLDEQLLYSDVFDEYFDIVQIVFYDLKVILESFTYKEELDYISKTLTYQNSYNKALNLKGDLISTEKDWKETESKSNWERFEEVCEIFYNKGLEKNENVLNIITDPTTNQKTYQWIGMGERKVIPPLRQFIKMLIKQNIYSRGKYNQLQEANAFLKFFGVTVDDPTFLFKEFRKDDDAYSNFFRINAT